VSPILDALAAASRDWIGDAPTGAMLSAMRAFLGAAPENESLLLEAAAALGALEPGSAAFVAVALGSSVERGADAQISGPAVLAELRAWLPRLPSQGVAGSPPVPTPDQAMLLVRFQFLCQSAVTHLAKLPELRATLADDTALLERLDELRASSHGAWWVHEALLKTSGTVVLLHPASATGLRLRYANVSNCFHLFSLLQTAVGARMPGGQTRAAPANDGDEAWWHYGSARLPRADSHAGIPGESLVRDIPRVDGEQLILLWPPAARKCAWDSGFMSPHLEAMPASVTVEAELSADETRAWLDKSGVTRHQRPWWRRWFRAR
jgi:hypothetical protein